MWSFVQNADVTRPLVSAVIPTYNRKDDVLIAVRTAVEQTYPAESLEILVVDDGGTDDTEEALRRAFGDRIRYLKKPNGGVSSARNAGLAAAEGEYLALLDSDDEWLPTKIAKQVAFLEAHPDFGMVLTHVERMDAGRVGFEIFDRRTQIPEDGWVLRHVLRNPALAPASAMFTRDVYEDVGGFDEGLRTAEDLDFHLRVALRWPIGVIDEVLTRAMRGHEGLSALAQSYRDYLDVVERFVRDHGHRLDARDKDAALLEAYARNVRGLLWAGDVGEALRCGVKSAVRARSLDDARRVAGLGADLARGLAVRLRRQVTGR
jgi:glycosyltransferase involved in cell wall biosynthesis